MKRKNSIPKEIDYVCMPNIFSIKLKHQLVNKANRSGVGITTTIFNENKIIFSNNVILEKTLSSRFDYDDILKNILKRVLRMDRDDFIKYISKGDMYGIQLYDNLEKVQSKLGTIIFQKN
jgi:hypothetical protein